MKVRIVATALWFAAGWSAASFFVGLIGLPLPLALVGGAAAAAVVWWDPNGRLFGARQRRVRPIDEVAAELAEQAAKGTEAVERVSR